MQKKIGAQTLRLSQPPAIISSACIGGKQEQEGPLPGTGQGGACLQGH